MISIELSLNKSAWNCQIIKITILLSSITSLLCVSAVYAAGKKAFESSFLLMMMAQLVNIIQLSIWESEPIHEKEEDPNHQCFSIDSTPQNHKMTLTVYSCHGRQFLLVLLCTMFLCTAEAHTDRSNKIVALGFVILAFRSYLALCKLMYPSKCNSPDFDFLADFTGLTLCKTISSSWEDKKSHQSDVPFYNYLGLTSDERETSSEAETSIREAEQLEEGFDVKNVQKQEAELEGLKDGLKFEDDNSQTAENDWEFIKSASNYEDNKIESERLVS